MTVDNQDQLDGNLDQQGDIQGDAGDQTQDGGNWYDSLGSDYNSNPSITKFKSTEDLAKSYVNLEKMIGKNKVVIPKEGASSDEWNAFYKAVGRPDDISGYKTPAYADDTPEELRMREDHLERYKAKALELGLNNKQYAELFALNNDIRQEMIGQERQKIEKMAQDTETALRKEWGDAYGKKVDVAQGVINKFFKGKNINPAFKVLANDTGFVKAMAELGESFGEDGIAGSPRVTLTPAEATAEYNAMISDSKNPLFDNAHPEHMAAVQKSIDLQRAIEAGAR